MLTVATLILLFYFVYLFFGGGGRDKLYLFDIVWSKTKKRPMALVPMLIEVPE